MEKNKVISIMAASLIVVAGLFFYGGMKFAQAKTKTNMGGTAGFQQSRTGASARQGMSRGGMGGGFVTGEILSKDVTSMTVKLQDGGSKIVFFTATTPVMKSVAGTSDDVAIGKTVMISGKTNPDGSVNADQIQLRTPQTQPVKIN